jgi:putative ABC transport system permease protein
LSLLGITIGIFCIIAVKSALDSLQDNIVNGFNELGSDVIYLDKQPWNNDSDINYWKYKNRPEPSSSDYEAIKRKAQKIDQVSFTMFTGGRTIKFLNNTVTNAFILGATFEYASIQNPKIAEGRYFTRVEYEGADNKVLLGYKIYNELFPGINGVGKNVKLFGQNYQVIGYLESEGENPFNFINFDEAIWIGFKNARKFVNEKDRTSVGCMLTIKAAPNTNLEDIKAEAAMIVRAQRRLKPLEEDNFSLNELSMLSQALDSVFKVINIAGFCIGVFSLTIGMFSVANIMFVSVKERTPIIGIKKAIGAKRLIILLEFLIESIILCIVGGIFGLLLVWIALKIATAYSPLAMNMDTFNMMLGLISSIVVGIIAGILPAIKASGLDPVEAIRA